MRNVLQINIGQKYNFLTPLKQISNPNKRGGDRLFECLCDCSNKTNVKAASLINNRKKSCGCYAKNKKGVKHTNYKKYIGKKFHNLYILSFNSKKTNSSNQLVNYYNYLCDCGKTGEIYASHIGRNKSCGCLSNKSVGEITGTVFSKIKQCAERRKIIFNLSHEFLWNLFIKQNRKCALTGLELTFASNSTSYDGSASLDRIDSDKNYTEDNVQWVHKIINNLKQSLSEADMYNWCKLYCQHNKERFQ